MSISRIPTELDDRIMRYLGSKELYSLCLTSKYYRSLAEPYLYMDIQFSMADYVKVTLLLLTVAKRQELPAHIKSIVISPISAESSDYHNRARQYQVTQNLLAAKYWEAPPILHHLIQSAWPQMDATSKIFWHHRFYFARNLTEAMDCALALLLSMALNLEYLDIGNTPGGYCSRMGYTEMERTRRLMWADHTEPPSTDPQLSRFFPKLKTLVIHGSVLGGNWQLYIPTYPSTEILRIRSVKLRKMFAVHTPPTMALRVLDLEDAWASLREFANNLRAGYLRNLQQLSFRRVHCWYESGQESELSSLSGLLQQCLPILEVLNYEPGEPESFITFGSLKGWKNLKRIDVDISSVLTQDATTTMMLPSLLPDQIQHVELSGVSTWHFDHLFQESSHLECLLAHLELTSTEIALRRFYLRSDNDGWREDNFDRNSAFNLVSDLETRFGETGVEFRVIEHHSLCERRIFHSLGQLTHEEEWAHHERVPQRFRSWQRADVILMIA